MELPLAPQPGRGVEMAYLEKLPPPEPQEAAALAAVWAEHAPDPNERRGRRDLVLPALRALQAARGWVSPEGAGALCRELGVALADAYGVASFYHMLKTEPGPKHTIYVCDDVACRLRGSDRLASRLRELLGDESVGERTLGWELSPCLGQCDQAPAALVGDAVWTCLTPAELETRSESLRSGRDGGTRAAAAVAAFDSTSVGPPAGRTHTGHFGEGTPLLLARCGSIRPDEPGDYIRYEGYAGLRRALELGPKASLAEVEASRLVGRGGAAFPAAVKWKAVAGEPGPRFVVCNADESEPGTFKDRVLLEQDPLAVIEGLTIAAYASGAAKGYIYLRGEYPEAARTVRSALLAARAEGLLGERILGSDFSFDLELRLGAGAYVCGEETALFNSLEGYRGEPRAKPPFPTQVGLFGRPTVVNNVETLAAIPAILRRGGSWYAGLGTKGSAGTKLLSVSGHVVRPGVYEVPFGVPLRRIIDELAGGVPAGRSVQAVLCGGAAGTFLRPDQLDVPFSFEGLREIGGTVGSGALVVYDEMADLTDAVQRIAQFFMDESCGQCVPCRVGSKRQFELIQALRRGAVSDIAQAERMLDDVTQVMKDASICGLGQLAPNAVLSLKGQLFAERGGEARGRQCGR